MKNLALADVISREKYYFVTANEYQTYLDYVYAYVKLNGKLVNLSNVSVYK